MSKITTLIFSLFSLIFFAGCARTVIPEEVLQLPEYTPVYTSYNLWANEKSEISSANVQKGTILPFGTEITFINANVGRTMTDMDNATAHVILLE